MQLNSKRERSTNSVLSTTFIIIRSVVLSTLTLNMYSAQHLDVSSKVGMEEMYSMNDVLKSENMSSPKKENVFQSMFSALNVIWEHFSRVPGTFMANINNPLSVTIVHNEGMISHEIFKSLTTRKESLTADNMYDCTMQTKESLNIVESAHCNIINQKKSCVADVFNECKNNDFKFSCKYTDVNRKESTDRSDKGETILEENTDNFVGSNKSKIDNTTKFNSLLTIKNTENKKEGNFSENKDMIHRITCSDYNKQDTLKNNEISKSIDSDTNSWSTFTESSSPSPKAIATANVDSVRPTAISDILSNMWQKVVDGVTDRLYLRTESVDSDMSTKRSFSPKQRRKLNTVAKGRGRGRARSQLRRSGVSQTRHRKERTKHDLVVDIQDDLESWQEFEIYHAMEEEEESIGCCTLNKRTVDVTDGADFITETIVTPIAYTFADVKPINSKPKTRKLISHDITKFPTRVRYVPECSTVQRDLCRQNCNEKNYDSQYCEFRPRLMSESSADSEDSYCIVFETESEANYKSDYDDNEESDRDDNTDDDEAASTMQKVKFNLKPIVHIMVQWDYAYRAARRGPWEEMARDRERFKGRINCIERVLNPILTAQHRTHIWQERFALTW